MKIIDTIQESFEVLRVNKLRTMLSVLGIIIGIGSVIALMTLGEASQASIKAQVQTLGTNLLTIRPGAQQSGGFLRQGSSDVDTLTYNDAKELQNNPRITTIDKVASEYNSRAQISYDRNNTNSQVSGVTANYFSVRNISVEFGRGLTDADDVVSAKYAILGTQVAKDLFGEDSDLEMIIGNKIRIEQTTFEVIGIMESKDGFNSPNNYVYVPLSTAQKILFGVDNISTMYVTAKDESVMDAAQNQIGFFLLERHGLSTPDEADFSISSQEDVLETVTQITNTFTMLLTGIAAISLVVGGIGIMNIMLVTVTERTSEIGLRKSLGAKKKHIIHQFIVESAILSITGGLMGVAVGIGVSYLIIIYMAMTFVLSYKAILMSVLVSSTIGLVFGLYPAFKASKLQPIEALRYE